ncbi:alpha/beta hydrolase [Streptomyces sp. NPDC001250]|uniref:alpha/beta hydrolase n=1 Tax=unclassified Streptomyces TaxID=2593676 RepID=UPI00331A13BA
MGRRDRDGIARLLTYPPERAAAQILDAVAHRRPRLLIGMTARLPDLMSRITPAPLSPRTAGIIPQALIPTRLATPDPRRPSMPALNWKPDLLEGYHQHTFELGADPDGEGTAAAVLVRRDPGGGERHDPLPVRGAVLYVHGFSDYFFQTELADFFAARHLAFYALDLRKCGRARRPGQTAHYVSDLALYDRELDLAVEAIVQEHGDVPVLLAAHSTGGLILPLWLDRRRAAGRTEPISGVVLNSPWFDLQGTAIRRGLLTQVLRVAAKAAPMRALAVPTSVYGDTLHQSRNGEWEFDLQLKPLSGFPVTVGWLNAVRRAHAALHLGLHIGVPSLILRSDRSHFSSHYSESSDLADLILDVTQIARWAGCLGDETTVVPIPGARHDVFLSRPEVRAHAYSVVDAWLEHHPMVTGRQPREAGALGQEKSRTR